MAETREFDIIVYGATGYTGRMPSSIHAKWGACQRLLLAVNETCETSYADRAGKYMGQRGVTLPKL